MRLLLDENCARRTLVQRLRQAAHDVETVVESLAPATPDELIVDYALSSRRVVVTQDAADFVELYSRLSSHPGLIVMYPSLHTPSVIRTAKAIENVLATYANLDDLILPLHEFIW